MSNNERFPLRGIIAVFSPQPRTEVRAFHLELAVKLWRLVTKLSRTSCSGSCVQITELTCIPVSAKKARNIKRIRGEANLYSRRLPGGSSRRFLSLTGAPHQPRLKIQCPYVAVHAPHRNSPTFSVAQRDRTTSRSAPSDTGKSFSIRHAGPRARARGSTAIPGNDNTGGADTFIKS